MQSIIIELFKKHNFLTTDETEAQMKATEKAVELFSTNKFFLADKLSSAAAGIYITYLPIITRAEDYQIETNSYALKEYPDFGDTILLSYLSPEQQQQAKLYIMYDYFNFQYKIAIESGLVDEESQYEVRSGQTRYGKTRYQMHYIR